MGKDIDQTCGNCTLFCPFNLREIPSLSKETNAEMQAGTRTCSDKGNGWASDKCRTDEFVEKETAPSD